MARTARQFPQGKFTLRTPKQTKNGQMYAIYIYYYWQGRQLRRSADLLVHKNACWTKMTEYHLPASVKNIRSVLNNQIETLYVDNPLDEIGFEAFIGCSSLKKIAYNATVRINKSANFSWARD